MAWLSVLNEKRAEINTLADLRGRTIDGGSGPGTPISLLVDEALDQAGLVAGKDVTLRFTAKTPGDMLTLAQNKAADVIGMNEPTATQADSQGLIVRWKSTTDIVPWYQGSPLAVSGSFLQSNPAAVRKFLAVYLIVARETNASNGEWTDDLLPTATSVSGFTADIIKNQGGPPLYEPNGTVSIDALKRLQDRWQQQGQVKQPVDPQALVEQQALANALEDVGRVAD
jgi:ABC-type nitrate/sulfonate/bicarbonate transport system substrate-binding protein